MTDYAQKAAEAIRRADEADSEGGYAIGEDEMTVIIHREAVAPLEAEVERWKREAMAWRAHRELHDDRHCNAHNEQDWNAYKEPREKAWAEICRAVNANDAAALAAGAKP